LPIAIIWISFYIGLFVYFKRRERGEKAIGFFIKFLVPKKFKHIFKKFSKSLYKDFPKVKDLLFPYLINFVSLIIYYCSIYVLAIALNINLDIFTFILFCPVINAISFLPISPGSIGVREITVAYLLYYLFGISIAQGVALSLGIFIIVGLPTMLLGFIFSVLASKDTNNKKIRNFSIEKYLKRTENKKMI